MAKKPNLNEFLSKPFCRIENCGDSAARHESSCSSVSIRTRTRTVDREFDSHLELVKFFSAFLVFEFSDFFN